MVFTEKEYRWRFDRTLAWLQEHHLDAVIVYSYKSALTSYWTGYSPRASVTNTSVFALDHTGRSVHITRHPLHLATASAAMPGLDQICASPDSTAVASPEDVAQELKRWLPASARTVGFVAYAPEAGFEGLVAEAAPGEVTNVTSSIWSLIAGRSDEQLERLREASHLAQTAFEAGVSAITAGEPLRPAAMAAESEVRRLGDIIHCFVGATDRAGNSLLHPQEYLVTPGTIITFEVIPEYNLFCPEVISTVYVGGVPEGLERVDTGIRRTLSEMTDWLSSHSSPADVAKANAQALVELGLPPNAAIRLGHGTGLDNIEPPEDFRESDTAPFGPSRVVSIHPNAVVPGKATVVRGGTVILTESGCEALFEFPAGPIVID